MDWAERGKMRDTPGLVCMLNVLRWSGQMSSSSKVTIFPLTSSSNSWPEEVTLTPVSSPDWILMDKCIFSGWVISHKERCNIYYDHDSVTNRAGHVASHVSDHVSISDICIFTSYSHYPIFLLLKWYAFQMKHFSIWEIPPEFCSREIQTSHFIIDDKVFPLYTEK